MAKINLGFKIFFFVGPRIGLNPLTGPAESGGEGSGPRKKNSLSKRAGFGPWGLSLQVGSGYEKTRPKPDPLPFLSLTLI